MLSEYRPILLSLFASLQRLRADPYVRARECWAIQNTLIEQITVAEGRIRKKKQLAATLRKRLGTPQSVRPTKDQSREIKEMITAHDETVAAEDRFIEILREVGDGLAFTYIDKWDIKPMAFKEPPGYLSGKDGFAAELAMAFKVFDLGGVAILNDLTHCLRYGDITVIREGEFAIVEAKSGPKLNPRGHRQLAANDRVRQYLETDRVVGLYGFDHEIRRVDLAHPEVTQAPILQTMIDEAFEHGGSYRQVEPGLHYMVNADDNIDGFLPERESMKGNVYVCMVNMLKQQNTAYFPFTLSIANPEHLYAFYNGEFVITIAVELDYVSQHFRNHGFTASFHQDEPWFLLINKNGAAADELSGLKISAHFWDRIFAEFVSLDWILAEITSKYEGMNALAV
jgi:hypothetical protein